MRKLLILFIGLLLLSCTPEDTLIVEKNLPLPPETLIPLGFHGSFDPISLPQAQHMVITPTTITLHLEGNQFGLANVYVFDINSSNINIGSFLLTVNRKDFIVVISKIVGSKNLYVTIKKPTFSIDLEIFIKQ